MTYISLLSDFAVVISSVRGFILTSVRLFLQMLNGREYEDQSHFKSRSCTTIVYIIQQDCDCDRFTSSRPQSYFMACSEQVDFVDYTI